MKIKEYYNVPGKRSKVSLCKHNIFTLLYSPVQKLLQLLHAVTFRKKTYKYEIGICLIFKNEATFLKEWIEYHKIIGVNHFYLYNNFSDDNFMEILNPYIVNGEVTLIDWPYRYSQIEAYNDCYKRASKETHWLGFIDADEFINLQKYDNLNELFNNFPNYPSVLFQWRMFGTSGHLFENNNQLVIEQYIASWPWLCKIGKTFINNDFEFCDISIHRHKARYLGFPLYPVNLVKGLAPNDDAIYTHGIEKFGYLNHYWSKSYNWYLFKDKVRGDVQNAENEIVKMKEDRFLHHEKNNSVHDYSIQRWLVPLKIKMNG